MSGKWTPGPWKVALTNPRWVMSSDNIIAEIEDELSGPDAAVQMAANARLIAQSPELFDALEMCVSALEVWQLMQPVPNDGLDRFVEKGRAVLAKAKGERS